MATKVRAAVAGGALAAVVVASVACAISALGDDPVLVTLGLHEPSSNFVRGIVLCLAVVAGAMAFAALTPRLRNLIDVGAMMLIPLGIVLCVGWGMFIRHGAYVDERKTFLVYGAQVSFISAVVLVVLVGVSSLMLFKRRPISSDVGGLTMRTLGWSGLACLVAGVIAYLAMKIPEALPTARVVIAVVVGGIAATLFAAAALTKAGSGRSAARWVYGALAVLLVVQIAAL
jgi:hypothetical protein